MLVVSLNGFITRKDFYLGIVNGLDARLAEIELTYWDSLANDQTKNVASGHVWGELYSYIEVSDTISEDIKSWLHDITVLLVGNFHLSGRI